MQIEPPPSNYFQKTTMTWDLDRIDFEILDALQNNARLSNKELAHAVVEPRALGIGLQAMIGVRLKRHTREEVAAFRADALARPEVIAIYHVTGNRDFLVHVAVRDSDHLRDLALEAFTTRPEVANLETSLIFSGDRKGALPILSREG